VPPRFRLRRCAAPEGVQFTSWGGPAARMFLLEKRELYRE